MEGIKFRRSRQRKKRRRGRVGGRGGQVLSNPKFFAVHPPLCSVIFRSWLVTFIHHFVCLQNILKTRFSEYMFLKIMALCGP